MIKLTKRNSGITFLLFHDDGSLDESDFIDGYFSQYGLPTIQRVLAPGSYLVAVSDYYLRLRSHDAFLATGQIDNRIVKRLTVSKLAGADRSNGEDIKFEIKPNIGIQLLPFMKVRV